MFNRTGKTLTIFVALVVILLTSSTSIGFYLYHKEERWRKNSEADLEASRDSELKLQVQLKDVQAQLSLSLDKNKEADQKINSLLDERDLNEGLRTALKKENVDLKEQMETINRTKEKIKADLENSNTKLAQYQDLLKEAQDKDKDLEARLNALDGIKKGMEARINELTTALKPYQDKTPSEQIANEIVPPARSGQGKVELDKIVVNPQDGTKGHILSVDTDAQFVIVNLGSKQGVKTEDVLSVYRGEGYLGDIKATRVQDEMSAADLIPPFSSNEVRKNDTVVLKP